MLTFFPSIFLSENAGAQSTTGGPITIWGQVYQSNGTLVGSQYDGTYAAVIIEHDGEKTTHYDDKGGLESGIYTVTIPEGDWSQGDVYWVIIDGTPWDDLEESRAEGIKINSEQDIVHSGTDHWVLSGPSEERRDVITLAKAPDELDNLEPLIAVIFSIIILVLGILFIGPLSNQKVNVVIMERKEYGIHRKSGQKGMYGYTCGYGHPKKPVVIGEIFGTSSKVDVDSKQTILVKKIIRLKNGDYNWYKPKIVFKGPPSRIDTVEEVDSFWFLGGGIELEKGESPQHAVRLNMIKQFLIFVLPFVILELLIGTISGFNLISWVKVPPWTGMVFISNLVILIIGVLVPYWLYWRAVKVKRVDKPLVEMPEIVTGDEAKPKSDVITSTIQPGPAESARGVLGGVVEDYPITPQKYLPPANLSNPVSSGSVSGSATPSQPTPAPQPQSPSPSQGGTAQKTPPSVTGSQNRPAAAAIARPVKSK
jgi:hypothetical protein